jgi:hypothetical protein
MEYYVDIDYAGDGRILQLCYDITIFRSMHCSNTTLSFWVWFEVSLFAESFIIISSPSRSQVFIEACEIIYVGFNTTSVSVEEGTGIVTLCVVILSGEHLRAFDISVYTINITADSNDFEAMSGQLLSFTALDSEQCFNVSITDDSECEYNEEICEDEVFKCVLETEEGSRVMAVDPFTSVYIQDRDDCGQDRDDCGTCITIE